MLVDIFLIVIVIVSAFVLLNILIGKFSILKKIKIEHIPKEKQKETKSKILEIRFLKALSNLTIFKKFINFFSKKSQIISNNFKLLEKKYKDKFSQIIKTSPIEVEKKIEELIIEGGNFLNENNLESAKEKFKEVISFDSCHLGALKNLFKIYFLENSLKEARDIGEYLIKINKQAIKWWLKFNKNKEKIPKNLTQELVISLINLGEILYKIDQNEKAILYFKSALIYNPNNPRILDFLIEISIILKKKKEAIEFLGRIKEINSENQKISEWEEKIINLNI